MSVSKVDQIFECLGNAQRRQILKSLESGPMSVQEISETLPVSRPAVSRHLKLLVSANLVTFVADGTRNIYQIEPTGFADAHQWLQPFWDNALQRFALVAENTFESEEG